MFLQVRTEDEDVVQVDCNLSFDNEVLEDVVHERRECTGRVGQAKEHNCGFKETTIGGEGCLPLVTSLDTDVVVSPSDVQGSEYGRVCHD